MSATTPQLEPIPAPEAPPDRRLPPRRWVKENLFYSPAGALMTVAFGAFVVWALFEIATFVFATARWEVVRRNLALFMTGQFPRDQQWRLWVAVVALAAVAALRAGVRSAHAPEQDRSIGATLRRGWPLLLLAVVVATLVRTAPPLFGLVVLAAVSLGMREVGRRVPERIAKLTPLVVVVVLVVGYRLLLGGADLTRWGGLLLTLFLAAAGIAISFPIGVLLALGRRSTLPAVRVASVGYIELFRGVPLVTVLFMGDLVVGFFLPPGTARPAAAIRALIGFVVFTAAYIAEIVRGGLQSVPAGQREAGLALGLSQVRVTAFIVLPQALRAVIPAIVGQFISLFKDTSLVATIGLLDLLRVADTVTKQPDFLGQGLHAETLVFASFIYWVGAYWMSRASQRLERRLGVGER